MHTPFEIANFFIRKGIEQGVHNDVTPMKLQKLVYHAHGWYLALYDRALVNEQIEAWDYGPVVPSLFRSTKEYGNNPVENYIQKSGNPYSPSPTLFGFVDEIWRIYGDLSGVHLSNMTHEPGTPWDGVYKRYNGKVPRGTDIPEEEIKSWFKKELEKPD